MSVSTDAVLDPDRMRAASVARVGYSSFGFGWEDGFERLVSALQKLDLTPRYIEQASRHIGNFLDARLYTERGLATYPQARDAKIHRPVIIAGLVRSGTTALHKLMSMDMQFQTPEHWLTMAPMPRPPREAWSEVPIYKTLAGYLDYVLGVSPELKEHHGMAVDEAEETLLIQSQTFCSNMFPSMYGIPDYDAWFQGTDEVPHYRRVADVLRLIGLNDPDRRWLLKNPTDLHSLGAVLEVFPDALVIQTHRDPVQAIPSVASTMRSGRRTVLAENPDAQSIGARESRFWAEALARAERVRQRTGVAAIDIEFRSFVADQLGTVRRIYEHFGLELSTAAESRMQAWLDANPRQSKSLQRVQPEEFGLTSEGLKAQFADYRARHGYDL